MPISSTVGAFDKNLFLNADGILTDASGEPVILNPGAVSLTKNAYFVDGATGDDVQDGSANRPWKTIRKAAMSAVDGSTIYVLPSSYTDPISRDNVIWELADGVVITASLAIVWRHPTTESYIGDFKNLIIRGLGIFTGLNCAIFGQYESCLSVEIEAKAIYGIIQGGYGTDDVQHVTRFIFKNIYFAVNTASGVQITNMGFGSTVAEIQFHNCRFLNNVLFSDIPYTITSCVARVAQTFDTVKIGTVLVNANMQSIPSP